MRVFYTLLSCLLFCLGIATVDMGGFLIVVGVLIRVIYHWSTMTPPQLVVAFLLMLYHRVIADRLSLQFINAGEWAAHLGGFTNVRVERIKVGPDGVRTTQTDQTAKEDSDS